MIASKSRRGEKHKVELLFLRLWQCDCMSFEMRGKCSHIEEAIKIKESHVEEENDRHKVLVR